MGRINKKNINTKKAFALLYAVVISSILLSIALGISNIAFREIAFGTSMKEGNDAFYAADTAAECILHLDNSTQNPFLGSCTDPSLCPYICNYTQFNPGVPLPADPNSIKFTFAMTGLGISSRSCANITLLKPLISGGGSQLTVVGNNTHQSTDSINQCNPLDTSVQRKLEVNY